jgi:hypothetical protein
MLDPKEEKKFEELKDRCRELKVPAPPEIMIGLKVHDKSGVLVFDDKQRGHSWTRNYYKALCVYFTGSPLTTATWGAGYLSIKTAAGDVYGSASTAVAGTVRSAVGSLGSLAAGIVCGTSDAAFSTEHYGLQAVIAQGTGAGQFSYAAQSATAAAYTAGTKTWAATLTRIMNNNSGGSITVKEVGLYWLATFTSLFERSVLDPTVAVANGAQLTVTYEISMDFSAID